MEDNGGKGSIKRCDVQVLNITSHRAIGLGVKYQLAALLRNSRWELLSCYCFVDPLYLKSIFILCCPLEMNTTAVNLTWYLNSRQKNWLCTALLGRLISIRNLYTAYYCCLFGTVHLRHLKKEILLVADPNPEFVTAWTNDLYCSSVLLISGIRISVEYSVCSDCHMSLTVIYNKRRNILN